MVNDVEVVLHRGAVSAADAGGEEEEPGPRAASGSSGHSAGH